MDRPSSARNAATAAPAIPPPMTTTSTARAPAITGPGWRARSGRGARRGDGTCLHCDPSEGLDEAVDLGGRVVVGQPDPDDAAPVGQAEALDQPGRVEVPIPDRDPVGAEGLGDVSRCDPG